MKTSARAPKNGGNFLTIWPEINLFLWLLLIPLYSPAHNPVYVPGRILLSDSTAASSDSLPLNPSPELSQVARSLGVFEITGSVTDAFCHGSSDGAIKYVISGDNPPFDYIWSNGVSGTVIGSSWNIVAITNLGSAQIDYQVRVVINFFPGMKGDFSDLRFTDTLNTTFYNYWLERKTDSTNAIFWVKIPSVPAGISYMRISYNNPSLTSVSNGYTTFEYFDDFNDGDISDWTGECQDVVEAGETCNQALEGGAGNYWVRLEGNSSCNGATTDGVKSILKKTITLPARTYKADFTTQILTCLHSDCTDSTRVMFNGFYGAAWATIYWYIQRKQACGCGITGWFEVYGDPITSTGAPEEVRLRATIEDCGQGWIKQDNFRIRKFSSPAPTLSIGPQVTLNLTQLAAGDYTINVTDDLAVSANTTFTVNQPLQPAPGHGSRCAAGTVDLSASGAYTTFKWYDALSGGTTLTTGSSYATASIAASTPYYVSGVGSNGCESTPRVTVNATVHPLPAKPIANDSSICGPGNVVVKASTSPLSYRWYADTVTGPVLETAALFSTPYISATTPFYVSSFDANGCESFRTKVNAVIDPYSAVSIAGADTVLSGQSSDTIFIQSRTGDLVNWEKSADPGFGSQSILAVSDTFFTDNSVNVTTFYRAVVKSGKCPPVNSNIVEVRVNMPHICAPDTIVVSVNNLFTSSENLLTNDIDSIGDVLSVQTKSNYLTQKGGIVTLNSDGTFSYSPPPNYKGADSVHYIACDLYEQNVRHCVASYLYLIVSDDVDLGLVIYAGITPNEDLLNDNWVIEGIERYPENEVTIFDRWGNVVFQETGYSNADSKIWKGQSNQEELNGTSLPEGTYFFILELPTENKVLSGYVVLKRN